MTWRYYIVPWDWTRSPHKGGPCPHVGERTCEELKIPQISLWGEGKEFYIPKGALGD